MIQIKPFSLPRRILYSTILQQITYGVYKRYIAFQKLLNCLTELNPRSTLSTLKSLDLGTGYYYPYPLLFYGLLKTAIGLDIIRVFWRDGIRICYKDLVAQGKPMYKAIGSATFKWLRGKIYYQELTRLSGRILKHKNVELHSYDGLHFPFDDKSFDCIVSLSVLEHLGNLPAVARECARVLHAAGTIDLV